MSLAIFRELRGSDIFREPNNALATALLSLR